MATGIATVYGVSLPILIFIAGGVDGIQCIREIFLKGLQLACLVFKIYLSLKGANSYALITEKKTLVNAVKVAQGHIMPSRAAGFQMLEFC